MRTLGNILWFIFGGLILGLCWFLAGVIMFCTIVGIPWARACFLIGSFAMWPFGREAIDRRAITHQTDIGTGTLGTLGNVLWFIFAGIWLAISHLTAAVSAFITIIGIPFGLQHLKLAMLSLAPIGKEVVTVEEANALRMRSTF